MSKAFHGAEYCWMNGNVMKTEEALVSAMEPIYLGIFEGIKAYVGGERPGGGGTEHIRLGAPHRPPMEERDRQRAQYRV